MKKPSNFSIAGIIFGIVFAVASFIRYWIIYPNKSEAIADILIGLLIIAVAYLYDSKNNQGNELEAIGNHLADLDKEKNSKGAEEW